MQHAIVPYVPPNGCSARAAHTRTFASFVRNGGRVEPIPLGAGDVETAPLLDKKDTNSEVIRLMKTANRQVRITQCAVGTALIFAVVVFSGLGVLVWRANAGMEALEREIMPHANRIVNTTIEMLGDFGGSMSNVHDITKYTNQLAATAGGTTGVAAQSLNSTAVIADRVAKFLSHPTIQLSLGGD